VTIAKQRRLPPCAGGNIAKERRIEKATGAENFGLGVRSAARGLWRGETGLADFLVQLNGSIVRWYEVAWREGAKACGVLPEDRTLEEQVLLDQHVGTAQQRVMDLGRFVEANSKANGGKWGSLLPRLSIWSNRYEEVKAQAQQVSCKDQKLMWVINPEKESCSSCIKLNGRVYRASIWAKYKIRPKMRELDCGGWLCGCIFQVTTEPVTPGRPPKIP